MKLTLTIIAIISITAFSIIKVEEIRYGSFDYPSIDVSDRKIDEKLCVKFLQEVNNKFNITSGYEILVYTDIGLEIYNSDTEDLISEIRSNEDTFAIRMNRFRDDRTTLRRVTSAKLMRNLLIPFEKYLKEHNVPGAFSVVSNNNEESVTIHFQKSDAELPEDILYDDKDHLEIDNRHVNQKVNRYKIDGLFDSYPEDQIEKGITYLKQYQHDSERDFLWYFKNLITPISPEESGGYEIELRQLEKGSNGKLKFTNYNKELNQGFTQLSMDINGKNFKAKNLPNWYSFEFLKQLNSFLSSNFNSGFYSLSWDRSPWDQMNFIYLTHTQFKKVQKSDLFKIGKITQKQIDLYDKDRIFKDRVKDVIHAEFKKHGFGKVHLDTDSKGYRKMARKYKFGHEQISVHTRVNGMMNYFTTSFYISKYYYKINDKVKKYYGKESNEIPTFSIQLNHTLPEEEKNILRGRDISFEATNDGLDSLGKACQRILQEYVIPFSNKLDDINYLDAFFNDKFLLPREKQNMFYANEYNMHLKRLVIAKLTDESRYQNLILESRESISNSISRMEGDKKYESSIDNFKKLILDMESLDKELKSIKPLQNKNLFE